MTRCDVRSADDEGSAMVEFIAVSLLLLIPLVYLVVTLGRIQAGTFAAEASAEEAARRAVVVGVAAREEGMDPSDAMGVADDGARAAAGVVLSDFGLSGSDDAVLTLSCGAGVCLEPGGVVVADTEVRVALPGIPDFVAGWLPLEVTVEASASAPVDGWEVEP